VTVNEPGRFGTSVTVFQTIGVQSLGSEVPAKCRARKHHVPLPNPAIDREVPGKATETVTGAGDVRKPVRAVSQTPY